MGYILNSKSYNSFTYGNEINVYSSKYFKDPIDIFDSNIIIDGQNKFGLKNITWNDENNLIYKNDNKSGYDLITSNIANSLENTVNLNNINYNIITYSLHHYYLPSINNYTSYIINSIGILIKSNTEIRILNIS